MLLVSKNFIFKFLLFLLFIAFDKSYAQVNYNKKNIIYIHADFDSKKISEISFNIFFGVVYPFVSNNRQTVTLINESKEQLNIVSIPVTKVQFAFTSPILVKNGDTVFLKIDSNKTITLSDQNLHRYFYFDSYSKHYNSTHIHALRNLLRDTALNFADYQRLAYQIYQADCHFVDTFFYGEDNFNASLKLADYKCDYIFQLYRYFVNHKVPVTAKEKNIFNSFIPFLDSIEPFKEVVPYYRMALDAVVKANANIIADGLLTRKQFEYCQYMAEVLYPTALRRIYSLSLFFQIAYWYNTTYMPLLTNIKDSLLNGQYSVAIAEQQAIIKRYSNFKNAYANILPYKNTPLITYTGEQILLANLLKTNKPIVLNFWATWCGPCIAEMPALDSLQKVLKDKIDLYTISIDKDKKAWQNFFQQRTSMQSYAYCIDKVEDNSFLQQYQIAEVPRFMVLLANGDILSANFPTRPNEPEFVNDLNELLRRIQVYYSSTNEN